MRVTGLLPVIDALEWFLETVKPTTKKRDFVGLACITGRGVISTPTKTVLDDVHSISIAESCQLLQHSEQCRLGTLPHQELNSSDIPLSLTAEVLQTKQTPAFGMYRIVWLKCQSGRNLQYKLRKQIISW